MSAAVESFEIHRDPLLGDAVALATSYDARTVRDTALSLLGVEDTDRILEVGSGDGRVLSELAVRAKRGFVAGVDPSELMLRHATLRNRRFIESGRVAVLEGRSSDLSGATACLEARPGAANRERPGFDKVLALHVIYFWEAPLEDLSEIHRALAPGGRLVLGYCPGKPQILPGTETVERCPCHPRRELERLLTACGFTRISTETRPHGQRPIAWTVAEKIAEENADERGE